MHEAAARVYRRPVSLQLPSLRIEGTHATKELDLDLSQTRSVYAEKDESFLIQNAQDAFVTARPEYHPAIVNYVAAHYAKLDDGFWVNPTGIHILTNHGAHSRIFYDPGLGVRLKSFRPALMEALIRRAGLVADGRRGFVAMDQVVAYDLAGSPKGRGVVYLFCVTEEAEPNFLNILEASDWLSHKNGSWSNPAHVRLLKGETLVYSDRYTLHIDELTPDAQATVRALPWVRADEGTLLNLNLVQIIGPPRPDDKAIVVNLGAGVEYAISKEANTKILASLIGFMPPTG